MLEIIVAILTSLVSPDYAERLRSTAPTYLTAETAREHLAAAIVASIATDTDHALLLSISHHESRHQLNTVTRESGGKVSCGVMTPEPTRDRKACTNATSSLVASYLAGARHLRGWIDACHGNMHAALLGYAGGFKLIRFCNAGGVSRGCRVPYVFNQRANWIRQRRSKTLRSGS